MWLFTHSPTSPHWILLLEAPQVVPGWLLIRSCTGDFGLKFGMTSKCSSRESSFSSACFPVYTSTHFSRPYFSHPYSSLPLTIIFLVCWINMGNTQRLNNQQNGTTTCWLRFGLLGLVTGQHENLRRLVWLVHFIKLCCMKIQVVLIIVRSRSLI